MRLFFETPVRIGFPSMMHERGGDPEDVDVNRGYAGNDVALSFACILGSHSIFQNTNFCGRRMLRDGWC